MTMSTATATIAPASTTHPKGSNVGKKNSGAGRPPSGKPPARQVSVRIPPDLDERLQQLIKDRRIPPTDTAVILAGLDLILTQEGYPRKTGGKQ
jgi:hypothetical protein